MNLIKSLFAVGTPPAAFNPGKPELFRKVLWFFRNPFQGFTTDVIGIAGQKYTTTGTTVGPLTPHGLTWRSGGGFNKLTHTLENGKKRSFVSYRGHGVEFYFGVRPTGRFGISLRRENATGF
jgi:hypothetical protein